MKTLLKFIGNLLLDFWNQHLKYFLVALIIMITGFAIVDIIGFITIGIFKLLSMDGIVNFLLHTGYKLDAPLITKGLLAGGIATVIVAIIMIIVSEFKNIKSYIGTVWNKSKK